MNLVIQVLRTLRTSEIRDVADDGKLAGSALSRRSFVCVERSVGILRKVAFRTVRTDQSDASPSCLPKVTALIQGSS
jgi:hypothetical protein